MALDNVQIRIIKTLQRGMDAGHASRMFSICPCTGITLRALKELKSMGLIDYIKNEMYIDAYTAILTPEGLGLRNLEEVNITACKKCKTVKH